MLDLIPVPTHWIEIGQNHVPEDVICIVEFVDVEGEHTWGLAWKSGRTHQWIAGDDFAIGERHQILRYSILTDNRGMTCPAPSE